MPPVLLDLNVGHLEVKKMQALQCIIDFHRHLTASSHIHRLKDFLVSGVDFLTMRTQRSCVIGTLSEALMCAKDHMGCILLPLSFVLYTVECLLNVRTHYIQGPWSPSPMTQ